MKPDLFFLPLMLLLFLVLWPWCSVKLYKLVGVFKTNTAHYLLTSSQIFVWLFVVMTSAFLCGGPSYHRSPILFLGSLVNYWVPLLLMRYRKLKPNVISQVFAIIGFPVIILGLPVLARYFHYLLNRLFGLVY